MSRVVLDSSPAQTSPHTIAETKLDGGALRLPGVLMQGITTVAPAIGVLLTLQFITGFAGEAAPLAYLLTFVLVLGLAIVAAQLAKHLPSAGGYFTYLSRTLHPRFGFLATWLMFVYPASPMVASVFVGFLLEEKFGPWYHWWYFVVFCAALVFVLMYRGIEISARALLVTGLIEIGIVVGLSVWGVFDPGPGGVSLSSYDPGNATSLNGLYLAVVFSVFAYTGWEAVAPVAEESEDPRRTVPRALIGTVICMGVLFSVCAWGLITGWGISDVEGLVESESLPAFVLADRFWGTDWPVVFALVNSALAVSIACTTASTRQWFAMARAGSFPAVFARVHERYRTPVNALALQTAVTLVLGIPLGIWWGANDIFLVFGLMFTLSAMLYYIGANVGVIRYFLTEKRSEFQPFLHLVLPVITTGVVLFVGYKSFFDPAPEGRGKWALPIMAAWLAIGVALLLYMRARGREDWLIRAGEAAHERGETPEQRERHVAGI